MFFHHAFDVLDDDNSVIDHDADREHDREQRYRVGGIADGEQYDESADQADRHRNGGNQGGAYAAEEQVNDDHDQNKCLEQRLQHLMDCIGDENRGVVRDLPVEIFRKSRLQFLDLGAHGLQRVDRV